MGRITSYDSKHGYYKIEYSDGDGEEMSHATVTKHLRKKYQYKNHTNHNNNNNTNNNNNNNNNTNNNNNNNNNHHSSRRRPLVQTNLLGEQMPAKDIEVFGHNYPKSPGDNSTIITFQNTGPQPASSYNHKAVQTDRAFKDSKESVALYAETFLNEPLI